MQAGRLERVLRERNGIEAERRRAESRVKVLETQRDVDIHTLQDLQAEMARLKLQLSCARAAAEEQTEQQEQHQPAKQPAAPVPDDKEPSASAVWRKAKAFEERMRGKSEVASSPKRSFEEQPKEGVRPPRSPNSQMREKLAKAGHPG